MLFGPAALPAQDSSAQPANIPSSQDILSFVNQSIGWYRHISTEQQIATNPEDIVFLDDDRQLAIQIVNLSFDFGLAYANIPNLAPQAAEPSSSPTQDRYRSFLQFANTADQQVKDSQVELDDLRRQLETAPARKRKQLESQISEVQSEMDLAAARRDTLRNMLQFLSGAASGGTSLRAQLEELQRIVPPANDRRSVTEHIFECNHCGTK